LDGWIFVAAGAVRILESLVVTGASASGMPGRMSAASPQLFHIAVTHLMPPIAKAVYAAESGNREAQLA